MVNMVFTTGHEVFIYRKLNMRSCVYTKRYTKHKPTYKVQTERQQNNMTVIVSRWDNSLASYYLAVNTSKLTLFEAVLGRMSGENCWLLFDASDGIWSNRLRYSLFCIRSSVRVYLW